MTTPTYYRDRTTPNRFYYIPGEPTPELAPNGAPTLLLWVSDQSARLQLGVQWKVTASEDAELRRIIALNYPALTPGALNLQPAPSSVQGVELLVGEDATTLHSVATATSAGFPPYTTLFAVTLDAAQMNEIVPERLPAFTAILRAPDAIAPRIAAMTGDEECIVSAVIRREERVERLIAVVGQAVQPHPRRAAIGRTVENVRIIHCEQRVIDGKVG